MTDRHKLYSKTKILTTEERIKKLKKSISELKKQNVRETIAKLSKVAEGTLK